MAIFLPARRLQVHSSSGVSTLTVLKWEVPHRLIALEDCQRSVTSSRKSLVVVSLSRRNRKLVLNEWVIDDGEALILKLGPWWCLSAGGANVS